MNRKPLALVVDDDVISRELLTDHLDDLGCRTITARDGEDGLRRVRRDNPDLVLLDLQLPELDGAGVLEELRKAGELDHLRVIVISAEGQSATVARSIDLGADDHIVKPFDPVILNARIESSLARMRLERLELEHQEQLEELVVQRTGQLRGALEQLRSLDRAKSGFLTIISHELRTPLMGMSSVDLLSSWSGLSEEERRLLHESFQSGYHRLLTIVDHALILTQLDVSSDGVSQSLIAGADLIAMAIEGCANSQRIEGSDVVMGALGEDAVVCNGELTVKALVAILDTAVKFSTDDQPVSISGKGRGKLFTLELKSVGYEIPQKYLDSFFEVLAIPDSLFPGGDLGLAPAMAQQVLSLNGGGIAVRNLAHKGVLFTITLPVVSGDESNSGSFVSD